MRELETGESGLRITDVLDTMEEEMASAAALLTPANCRSHIDDLPQDVDVVRVVPVRRKVKRRHRFLSAA